jgi:Cdc6-like AAA superfamily ATPase
MAAAAVNDSSSEINVVIIGETGTGRNSNIEDIFRNLE